MIENKLNTSMSEQELIYEVINYYCTTLRQSAEAMQFLTTKGFKDYLERPTAKLGFCNRTLGSILPSSTQENGKTLRTLLSTLGIFDNNGREVFHGCAIFPITNDGVICGLYGHRIVSPSKLRKSSSIDITLMFEKTLMNQCRFSTADVVLIFENYLDAFLFEQYGWITTVYSGNIKHFQECGFERVIFMITNNSELSNSQFSLLNSLSNEDVSVWQCRLPEHWFDLLKLQTSQEVIEGWIQSSISLKGEGQLLISKAGDPKKVGLQQFTSLPLIQEGDDLWLTIEELRYRIRGSIGNDNSHLKVNLLVQSEQGFFIDIIDLYQAKQRLLFAKMACIDCRVNERQIKNDLGQLILSLEHYGGKHLSKASIVPSLSDKDKKEALDWLHNKDILKVLQEDLGEIGIVGESENRLLAYLACTSRLLPKPIAILIQSSSSAGKSLLMDGVLKLIPKESQYAISTLTSQSLYYMEQGTLEHKILSIAEEEGVAQASYALKLLQSQGEVSIATASRSKISGQMSTSSYTVKGPVMLFLTTTSVQVDEELMNRCLVVSVNESREQTARIHQYQRFKKTLEGWQKELLVQRLIKKHHNVQRLLKPYKVINPFAKHLSFSDSQTRTRRDHEKYLTLIESITLLHQYQRCVKKLRQGKTVIEYIEVTLEDIQLANKLAIHVFKQTFDEIPPQTRHCLDMINDYVKKKSYNNNLRFSKTYFNRRDLREFSQLSQTQIHIHCKRLETLEYLLPIPAVSGKSKSYLLNYKQDQENQHLANRIFDFSMNSYEGRNKQMDLTLL